MATLYVDFLGGNDSNDATSFANRVKTITSSGLTAARTAPGDTIRIMKSPDPTSLGQNATFTNASRTVTLTSAVTLTIDNCESAWTSAMGANGSTSTTATSKEGTNAATIVPGAGFTTGMMAYKALAGATDFSSYQQISFWIKSTVATHAASDLTIRLCSDAVGAVTVDTLNLPAIPTANVFQAVVIDKGSALGSSIQSVAIDVNTDRGANTITIDNLQACKAASADDSLTLHSLIGKNSSDGWWPIKSISGTTVILDQAVAGAASVGRGYSGTTATTTAYKREPIVLPVLADQVVQESGSLGNISTYSGGWDTTNMSSQTGETWITFQNGVRSFNTGARSFLNIEKIGQVRCDDFSVAGTEITLTNCYVAASSNTSGGFIVSTGCTGLTFVNCMSYANLTMGWFGYNGGNDSPFNGGRNLFSGCKALSNGYSGFGNGNNPSNIYSNCTASNNAVYGFSVRGGMTLRTCSTADNGTSGVGPPDTSFGATYAQIGDVTAYGSTFAESTEFTTQGGTNYRLTSVNHDGTTGNHKIITDYGVVATDTSVRHVALGASWKFSPTNAARTANYPLSHVVGRVLCAANKQVTVKYWFRRDNTGITGKLVCGGYQIAGVTADVTATMSAGADTWEQLSISFTPTEAGVVQIEAQWYGGTTYNGYVHDATIFQG